MTYNYECEPSSKTEPGKKKSEFWKEVCNVNVALGFESGLPVDPYISVDHVCVGMWASDKTADGKQRPSEMLLASILVLLLSN